MKASLQSRITLAMWAMAAFSAITTAFLFGSLLIRSHRESIRQQLQSAVASLVSLGISDVSELEDFSELNHFIEDALPMERADKIIRVFDQNKKLVFTTVGMNYDQLPDTLTREISRPQFLTMSGRNQQYETLVMNYETGKKKRLFYLQVAIPLPRYWEIFETLWWQGLILLLALFGISLWVSRFLARRMLRPVTEIAAHLEGMDPRRIEAWKPLESPAGGGRYLDEIVAGVNRLTQRTRSSVLQLRKMSRYVAHELRTPLTILRGEAETVLLKPKSSTEDYERVLRSSLEEVQRMTETVSTVLQVGEDSGAVGAYRPMDFDLKEWLMQQIPAWEKSLGRPLRMEIPKVGSFEIRNDPKLLFRLVDNLVRNVQRHAPSGANCRVGLTISNLGLILFVEDGGLPIPKWMVEAMNRAESVLETEWVGLNLCHTLAEICGLGLNFSARKEGGLRVEIALES
ncbi:MAG: hypothetical protein K8R69_08960 [Deltaproteobacteria bacterium]|nr:hypothetical protein [Deltaproteobacteria bacterium]